MSLSITSFIIKNDNTLWGCGRNYYGRLGLGKDTADKTVFTQIITNTDGIKSVYCGYDHTLMLKNDGTLWSCGYNGEGELGLGDTTNRYVFTQIITNTDNIKSVYCGESHTIILKNDGTLWGCGNNNCGQLGLGNTSNRKTFTKITDNVKSVDCGYEHTVIFKNDGTLWGCGNNSSSQLGLEKDTSNKTTFTKITINVDNIKSVYCGSYHSFILKNDGTLWGCGKNDSGQLGLGDINNRKTFTLIGINTNNIKSIYCGGSYTLILKNDGTLWGCGANSSGQLGLEDTKDRTTFTQITNDVKLVYCGYSHIIILKNDGTLWGSGLNQYGQLGLGNTSNRNTFTQITKNVDNIKSLANNYNIPNTIKIYDSKIGYVETLDTNNFRSIPINTVERLKSLCINPPNTYLNCLISFDKKQTWKTFNNSNWLEISDISPENIILNGMNVGTLNQLDSNKLISGGFTGDLDFKIAMKTNDTKKTPSITKIYIEYK